MKIKIAILALLLLCMVNHSYSDVLDIPNIQQEETNWCWAGCSEAILIYYGFNYTQDEIAEYGTEGVNTWNWLWGESNNPTRRGIDMILYHFGQIETCGTDDVLTLEQINNEIDALRPFVIRFEWNNGGGHFIVGKGYYDDMIFAMDPWTGNSTYNDYDWFCQSSQHTWTHTLALETSPTEINDNEIPIVALKQIYNYPNPFCSEDNEMRSAGTTFEYQINKPGLAIIDIYNTKGEKVSTLTSKHTDKGNYAMFWNGKDFNNKMLSTGIYFYKLILDNKTLAADKCILIR